MNIEKEVYFDKWCPKCKYAKVEEQTLTPKDPCWDCLHEPGNFDSRRPRGFTKAEESKKGKIAVESYTVSEG